MASSGRIKFIKDSFFDSFSKKDLRKSALIHLSFFGTMMLQNISSHYDDRNEMLRKQAENPPKIIAVSMVSSAKLEEIKSGKRIYKTHQQEGGFIDEIKEAIEEKTALLDNAFKDGKIGTNNKPKDGNLNMPKMQEKTKEKKVLSKEEQEKIDRQKAIEERKKKKQAELEEQKRREAEAERIRQEELKKEKIELDGIVSDVYDYDILDDGNALQTYTETLDERSQVITMIENQMEQCWAKYSVGKRKNNIVVEITAFYDRDGNLTGFTDATPSNKKTSGYYEMARDARLALRECSPLSNVDVGMYEQWKEVNFYFKYRI